MFKFNVGAARPAIDAARTARIADANDLVRRTLSQHGLMPDQTGGGPLDLSGVNTGLGAAMAPFLRASGGHAVTPDRLQMAQHSFSCSDGSRDYRTYVPTVGGDGHTGLVVMLHGCTQNPEDFATGTGMNALADTHGFVVVYPHQSRGENSQSCWNWFRRGDQRRDRGEPAILAGIAREVAQRHSLPDDRIYAAGLSAGAAMAVILGQTYPDVFAAVGVHSGLAYGAATDVPTAFAAMAGRGQGASAVSADAPAVPTIVFHGTADSTVHPSNADRIVQDVGSNGGRQTVETTRDGMASGRRFQQSVSMTVEGAPQLEDWRIEGLGHAWSGGQPGGSFTDQKGPDASAEMVRFFYDTQIKG